MTAESKDAVRLGVVGVGGWAVRIIEDALAHGPRTDPPVQLVAVSTTSPQKHAEQLTQLRAKDVAVAEDMTALLGRDDLDAVWLPLPIQLHRPVTEQALAAGKAVMCEKPVSGAIQDADAMIAARDRAGLPLAIAYNHIYDPMVPWLKRRLADGLIGTIERASLAAFWPRHVPYYQRNNWAGTFQVDGQWVMDSPANNALAHFVHLALFVLGPDAATSARPERLAAELYRAQECENFDTIALRAALETGTDFLLLMTHACREQSGPVLTLQGTAGRVVWDNKGARIEGARGQETVGASPAVNFDMLERFARLVRGREESSRVYGTVEMARAQTLLVNAASAASPVVAVPREAIVEFDRTFGDETFHYRGIRGIEECFVRCQNEWQLPHETGMLAWSRPAGELDVTRFTEFKGPRAK